MLLLLFLSCIFILFHWSYRADSLMGTLEVVKADIIFNPQIELQTIIASRVLERAHPNMNRLATSMVAVRYINPFLIGIYVMSMDQMSLG